MSSQILQGIAETRRSIYALTKDLPISKKQVEQIVEHALLHTPSSFNSQSTRLVILFGTEHDKLWEIAKDELKAIVPTENFAPTETKLNGFKAAAGTVLFFEDETPIKNLQEKFPTYAHNFPTWAEHANAMAQYAIWTTLASVNVGANLQHYSPIIDQKVTENFDIPNTWHLKAQLVFGGIGQTAGEKSFLPVESRLKVLG